MLPTETIFPPEIGLSAAEFCRFTPQQKERWVPFQATVAALMEVYGEYNTFNSPHTPPVNERSFDRGILREIETEGGQWFPSLELGSRIATSVFSSKVLKQAVVQHGSRWFESPVFTPHGEWTTLAKARLPGLWASRVLFCTAGGRTMRAAEASYSQFGTIGCEAATLFGLQFSLLSEAIQATRATLFAEGVRLPGRHVPYLKHHAPGTLILAVLHENAEMPDSAVVPVVVERRLVFSF